MPELPEVEEVRRTLEPHLLGRVVEGIRVNRRDFLTPDGAPVERLVGRTFARTVRHGKKLFCVADDGQTLVVHLGMSGRVDCVVGDAKVAPHTHIVIRLKGEPATEVRFRDPRRFGGVWYYGTFEEAWERETKRLGKDALAITAGDLAHWRNGRGRLKQRLLSQKDVAGLGNIYVDEALWMAKLNPRQRVDRISPAQVEQLVAAIHRVLEKSIRSGGTTLRDYRNVSDQPGRFARQLVAYGRGGKPCGRCRAVMKSVVIGGRTTVFCPVCQKSR